MTRVTYLLIFLFFTCSSLTIQAQPSYSSADSRVRSYIHTLPESLFRRLIPDLLLISQYENSLETLPSYKKRTRWYPKHSIPKMPIEEAIARLIRLVEPLFPEGTPLVGAEWWTQYISSDAPLGFHVDKDESIATHKHYLVHPIWSSVFYMSESGGGTLIPNQYSPNGNGYDPVQPNEGEWSFPTPNKFLLFRGNLLHGVIPGSTSREKRLTFLINFWSVVPEPPNCELLRYSDVKGLRTYSDDEMEAWRQEWDDDRSEKRVRQALARVDMTEGTSVPHFVYKIVLPGGATEDVRLPKTTTPGQTYTITWNSGSSKSSKSTSPSSSSSSSSSTPNIADIVSQAARSQSAKQKKAKKKKSEKKQKKIKIEDDEEDENDTDERTNDTSTRTHSSSSTKTSTQTSTSPPPSASIPPPRARSKSRVREAKNDLVRRIKDEL